VVSPVEALEAGAASRRPELVGPGGKPRQRSWAVSPKLFPCELSAEAQAAIAGVRARWGHLHSICTRMRPASRARGPEPGRILSACLAGCTEYAHVPAPAARPRLRPCAAGTPRASRARSARRAGHCESCAALRGELSPAGCAPHRALTGGGARPAAAGGRGGAQRVGRARAAGPGGRGPAVGGLRARADQRPRHRLPARRLPGAP